MDPLKNFRTYHLAVQFYKDCLQIKYPDHMKNQILRASLSVVNNLAEGSAKKSAKERAKFYEISLASFREVQAMLRLLNVNSMLEKYDVLGVCLYKLRKNTWTP